MAKRYSVNDGKLVLTIEECGDGWLTVTSPIDPGLVTQGRSLKEAFEMAKDALQALRKADVAMRRGLVSSRRKRRD